ncbi:hypothetical protein [Gordonia sputi]
MTTRSGDRVEFLTDVYTTALEGGIGYWAECTEYQWSTTQRAAITDIDGDHHTITLDTIAHGLTAITTGRITLSDGHRHRITTANRTNDAADLDANDADLIVQAALFGTITYG